MGRFGLFSNKKIGLMKKLARENNLNISGDRREIKIGCAFETKIRKELAGKLNLSR
jgi:hypothetical protein